MALAITLSATTDQEESFLDEEIKDTDDATKSMQSDKTTSLRGRSRLLASRATVTTCDKYPRVCRASGSAGPDCCKKKCVDTNTDRVNCGTCGKKCKYGETCCKGKCVNPRSDKKNCGSCNNKCKKGSSCVYGMCSYA
ncbi:stigma-specific STIG1-like protein 2 [Pyrus communis]|uniref:stigma-specific STIG1-like protein 2 n=1 Tax=Pyrus communis TaxID=23211 RepID=UPI0035C124AE